MATAQRWIRTATDARLAEYLQEVTREALSGNVPFSWYEASLSVVRNEVERRVSERARLGTLGKIGG